MCALTRSPTASAPCRSDRLSRGGRSKMKSARECLDSPSSIWTSRIETSHADTHIHHHSMAHARACTFNSARSLSATFDTIRCNGSLPPTFLAPAIACMRKAQFSTTTSRASKIGRAPLPLPPDVTFTVSPPPPVSSKRGAAQQGPTVEVVGPLGKMTMTIPPFVTIAESDEGKARTVSVLDTTDKKQRAMWGEYVAIFTCMR